MSIEYWFDIGNTRGKFWITRNGRVTFRGALAHSGDVRMLMTALPLVFEGRPAAVFGVCVLGEAGHEGFEDICRRRWGMTPRMANSRACDAGVVNGYLDPARLGVDRWLGVLAASPANSRVGVVLCGTALTLDVVEGGSHAGGYIMPGLALMTASLVERTRGIRCEAGVTLGLGPGLNTSDAVARGGLLAAAGYVERIVRQEMVSRIILAGGDACRLSGCLQMPHFVDPDLLLKGLQVYFGRDGAHHQ